jgi:hypothetical protein
MYLDKMSFIPSSHSIDILSNLHIFLASKGGTKWHICGICPLIEEDIFIFFIHYKFPHLSLLQSLYIIIMSILFSSSLIF